MSARRIVHSEQTRKNARRLAPSGPEPEALRMPTAAGGGRGRRELFIIFGFIKFFIVLRRLSYCTLKGYRLTQYAQVA